MTSHAVAELKPTVFDADHGFSQGPKRPFTQAISGMVSFQTRHVRTPSHNKSAGLQP